MTSPQSHERGMALVAALLLLALLFMLGMALLSMSDVEYRISSNDQWSEGALHAAEAGVHTALTQLSFDTSTSTVAVPDTSLGTSGYSFRSGKRGDAVPQTLQFTGATTTVGFTANAGTGYNPSGYVFYEYLIESTGNGPRNAQRELEALASFGPLKN